MLRCKARALKSQYANTQQTGWLTAVWSIRVLCEPRRHQKMQHRACIASRMLSSSPRQTLREPARDHEQQLKLNPAHQLVVGYSACVYLRMRSEGYCSWVCLSVCYSQSHFSSVCSSHKGYNPLNGQRRSENMWGFL